jgi:hypothetical protein
MRTLHMTEDHQQVCYNFAVHERPCAVWSLDLESENHAFLAGIDHSFFSALVDTQVPLLESDEQRMNAALAIRLTYGHALETFCALIGATLQAPHCPLGWVLAYKPEELRSVLEDVHASRLRFSRLPGPPSWESLSEVIHRRLSPDKASLKGRFAHLWRRLADDYINELKAGEYNSLKHGLRVQAGGFSLRIGSKTAAAPPIVDSSSIFGSRFYQRSRLDRHNFSLETAGVNWNPVALALRVELLAVSINNIICYLKECCATERLTVRLLWPEGPEYAWELPWEADFMIEQMRGGRLLTAEDVALRTPADILSTYDDESEAND